MTALSAPAPPVRRVAFVALVALVATLPAGNLSLGPVQVVQAMAVLPVIAVATAAAVELSLPLPPWQIGLPLAAMPVSAALSSVSTPVPEVSLNLNIALVLGLLVVVAMWAVVDRPARLVALVALLVLAGAGVGIVSVASAGDLSTAASGAIVRGRASGIFAQPNELGIFTAMLLPVATALTLARVGAQRVVAGLGVLLIGSALVLSLSRGAWLGAVVGIGTLAILLPDRRSLTRALAMGATTVGVLFVLLAPPSTSNAVAQRVSSVVAGEDNPYDERPEVYADAARQFADSPLVGQGPGAFSHVARGLTQDGYDLDIWHAHSLPLVVATEHGIVGVAALLGLALGLTHLLRRDVWSRNQHRGDGDRQVTIMAAGLFGGLAAALAHGLVDYPLRNPVSGMTAWLVLALTVASIRCVSRPEPATEEDRAR